MSGHDNLLGDFVQLLQQVISVDIPAADITESTGISTDLMIDSISLVSLVALCEERFGVDLSSRVDDIANIATVGDALALIRTAGAAAAAA